MAGTAPGEGSLWQMGSADFSGDRILHMQRRLTGTSVAAKKLCCSLMLKSSVCHWGKDSWSFIYPEMAVSIQKGVCICFCPELGRPKESSCGRLWGDQCEVILK